MGLFIPLLCKINPLGYCTSQVGLVDVVMGCAMGPFSSRLHHCPSLVHPYLLMSTSITAEHRGKSSQSQICEASKVTAGPGTNLPSLAISCANSTMARSLPPHHSFTSFRIFVTFFHSTILDIHSWPRTFVFFFRKCLAFCCIKKKRKKSGSKP